MPSDALAEGVKEGIKLEKFNGFAYIRVDTVSTAFSNTLLYTTVNHSYEIRDFPPLLPPTFSFP